MTQKKDYKLQSVKMQKQIAERLDNFCLCSGQTKTFIIEQAVLKYMDEFESLYKKMRQNNNAPM